MIDFGRTPFTVIWEVTRACDLRCVHCRADTRPRPDPRELTTAEGYRLLDEVRDVASPVFVITGGDPLKRADLFDLVEYGARIGIPVAVTPSGTPLLRRGAVPRLKALGVKRLALSLDAPTADAHDRSRQQRGSYAWTVAGARQARECDLPLQINTTVTRRNVALLDALADVVTDLGAVMWSAFFLVTVGRARESDQLSPEEFESTFAALHALAARVPFAVRTTAAPHYRRYILQQAARARRGGQPPRSTALAGVVGELPRARRGVTDGNGLVFISHTGEVYPSGFLPISAGNVRRTPLAQIYRDAPIFRRLRDEARLGGKCGVCEFRRICGGSRARAYAVTGDPLAEDPSCVYQPRKLGETVARETDAGHPPPRGRVSA